MIDKFVTLNKGINLENGNIKLMKKGVADYISLICFLLALITFFATFIGALLELNFGFVIMSLLGMVSVGYILLISAYTQLSKNYYIEVENPKTFDGFELYYKEKLINLKYQVDSEGKFKWSNNNSKLELISYSDGAKMSIFTKYRIINYFSKWLEENNYLSKNTDIKIEKL